MIRLRHVPTGPLLAIDLALALAVYRLAFFLRETIPIPGTAKLLPKARFDVIDHRFILLVLLLGASVHALELDRNLVGKRLRELMASALGASGLASLGLVFAYFMAKNPVFPRSIVPIYWLLQAAALVLVRQALLILVRPPVSRVALVGRTDAARFLIEELNGDTRSLRRVVAVLREDGDDAPGDAFCGVAVAGGLDRASELVRSGEIDEILLAPATDWRDRLLGEIARLERTGIRMVVAPSLYEVLLGKLGHVHLRDRPLIEVVRDPSDFFGDTLKRLFDIVLALALTPVALLISLVLAPMVRIGSPGSMLFRQRRVGRQGREFTLLKLRTMVDDAEKATGPTLAEESDPRITPVGRFLRRSRLDELPQLWNILVGEMSFVGPRPERPEFAAGFARDIPGYAHRHLVRPGLTGLAQVRGTYHTDAAVKLMYDLIYVYNRSLGLDVLILAETARTVLLGRGVK